jgi:Flp pilus assembly protein TadB
VSAGAFHLLWPVLAGFIALPALAAARRRRRSREASAVASELAAFASIVRAADRHVPLDEGLRARILRLRMAEAAPLSLAEELQQAGPQALADTAQRLASRLRRHAAFERKMLARTAPGLRRGAFVACLPPLMLALLHQLDAQIPGDAQLALLALEAVGCALLWRLARVEI